MPPHHSPSVLLGFAGLIAWSCIWIPSPKAVPAAPVITIFLLVCLTEASLDIFLAPGPCLNGVLACRKPSNRLFLMERKRRIV